MGLRFCLFPAWEKISKPELGPAHFFNKTLKFYFKNILKLKKLKKYIYYIRAGPKPGQKKWCPRPGLFSKWASFFAQAHISGLYFYPNPPIFRVDRQAEPGHPAHEHL
ncbi:hypothetical protein V6Z12_D09G139000 [Gossypium hirsutum]